jgi:quercetin dioxygenase-like cupin family protein
VLEVDGEVHTVSAPAPLLLKAGTVHGVTAITDVIWLCIWGVPEGLTGENVDDAISGS